MVSAFFAFVIHLQGIVIIFPTPEGSRQGSGTFSAERAKSHIFKKNVFLWDQ